jgi:two-component system osmolarity sensor histidine kinase EnvZ
MKTPVWFPQSYFSRTLWLVLIVVLFSKMLTLVYLMANEDMLVDRQYSHGAAMILRTYWSVEPHQREEIAQISGLRRISPDQVPKSQLHWPYSEVLLKQMRSELGPDTEIRLGVRGPSALWVLAPSLGPDWIRVPLYTYPLRGQRIWSVLGWFVGIGLLSTAAAWLLVRQLSAPLKRLVIAARQLGRGLRVRLPETDGPSEMAEVYRAFNQMATDVEQASRERELMLAGVSHDLRTPLTRLRLSLELLRSDPELTADMVRDIEDMDAILDQFMAFVRDGRDEPPQQLDLSALVREVVEPYNQHAEQVRLCLQQLPPCSLRPVSIKRLLSNLIDNALRYAGQGVEVSASVAGGDSAPYLLLSVLDRGPGIEEGSQALLFNPFARGDAARGGHGSGLGLAIVRRIAALHGGSVELRNRAGGGLEARVCLPIGLLLPRDAV